MTTIWEKLSVRTPDGVEQVRWRSRVFVPSTVFDNKILLANDPGYLTRLAALPEKERRALLYGDWDCFAGQVFTEWRNDPEHYADRIGTHVVEPFAIPPSWRIVRGFDWGYSRPFSVGWYAFDNDGRMYRIRELYGCSGSPNEGVRWGAEQVARRIREIEQDDPNLRGRFITGVADPAIRQKNGGESIAELMEKQGVYWDRADNSRLAGKAQMHARLAFDDTGVPMFYVFSTCRHFIRTFPELVYDAADVEDIDTDGEDHIYDECRYVAMAHPIQQAKQPKHVVSYRYDPLSN